MDSKVDHDIPPDKFVEFIRLSLYIHDIEIIVRKNPAY